MSFTTQIFIFVFFPACFITYFLGILLQRNKKYAEFLRKVRFNDIVIIVFSFGFYMWSCFDDIFRIGAYILVIYLAGHTIEYCKKHWGYITAHTGGESRKIWVSAFVLIIAVSAAVFYLVHFKYIPLITTVWNFLARDTLIAKSIIAPIGISFITFSSISYLVDIHRGSAPAGSLIDCVLYLMFFPKIVSGPIVLWRDFQPNITTRTAGLDVSVSGLNRIMIGFAKKLILADQFGACIARIASSNIDIPTAWGTMLLYMLQIYYDFSGYSDIAMGLSRLFGFEFKENFHFPYLSQSISEFWRRWHISLGTWFREYIYFPLGGSRKGERQTERNLAIIFALTGMWHGAGLRYLLWGGINGVISILERRIQNKSVYQKMPAIAKWGGTMLLTMFCWGFFRFDGIGSYLSYLKILFGFTRFELIPYTWQYYYDSQVITLAVIAFIGATLLGLPRVQALGKRITATKMGYLILQVALLLVFVIAILFMVNSTYSPFIYFQY